MPHSHYRQYMLLLLILLGVSSTIDRGLIALAVEPIKAEFQLGDAQIGLMNGFAFALFYAFAGIPIARWADRGNRNHVLTVVAALWSVMVVLSSMVTNFAQLLVVRVGVAVGESGCIPAAQSLISDYYSREERPKAIAIFWLCIPIATLLSFIGGGWLIEQVGWRYAFMIVGLPGLLLAILVKTTLREPRLKRKKSVAEAQPSFKSTLSDLWNGPVLRQLVLLYSLIAFFWTGISIWLPAFYMRSHGMSVSEVGVWIGLSIGCGGLLFTYLGGHLATRYAPGKESLQMKAVAFIMVLCVFFASSF